MSMFHLGWFVGRGLSPQSWPPGPFAGAGQESWWDPQLYIDLAASLERAGFDYVMIEDGMFVPDVYGGGDRHRDDQLLSPVPRGPAEYLARPPHRRAGRLQPRHLAQ